MDAQLPTLDDILLNNATPPWTLRAFAAHLNQHRCLEVLQFVFDADRYATRYGGLVKNNATSSNNNGAVDVLWRKLMQLYIHPSGRQQLNIPEREREHLLHLPSTPPPRPSELREACRCAYDLLNDSLAALFQAREPKNPLRQYDPISRSTGPKSRGLWRQPGGLSCAPELESQATNEDGNSCSRFPTDPLARRIRYAFVTNVKKVAAALSCTRAT